MPKHDPNDPREAAVTERRIVYNEGYKLGEGLVGTVLGLAQQQATDEYLIYLFLLGVKQAIENKAREVGAAYLPGAREDAQRKGRVDH